MGGGWLFSGPANSSLALFRFGTAGGGGDEAGWGEYSCVIFGVMVMMPGAGVTTTLPAVLKRELGAGCRRVSAAVAISGYIGVCWW